MATRAKKSSGGRKRKSRKQVGLLLSSGSPLTEKQRDKLKGELRSGTVKVGKR